MSNTSATGGYLTPDASALPAEDTDLEDIFQQMVVGLTGLPGALVRPSWPDKVPKQPEPNVSWCALAITIEDPDNQPAITHDPAANNGNGGDVFQRHEKLTVLCTFYGPQGQKNAAMTRDGVFLNQNNSILQANYGIGLNSTGQIICVPELVNQQWVRRYDLQLKFSRSVVRTYPVYNLLSAPFQIQKG